MSDWREGQAAQYDTYVAAFDAALDHIDNLEDIFKVLAIAGMETESRSYAGGVRAARGTLVSRARELRSGVPETILPISLTTRRVQ